MSLVEFLRPISVAALAYGSALTVAVVCPIIGLAWQAGVHYLRHRSLREFRTDYVPATAVGVFVGGLAFSVGLAGAAVFDIAGKL